MAESPAPHAVDPAVAAGDLLAAKPTPRPRELRAMLLDRVTRDLYGPLDGPEEELDGRLKHPRDYILGALAPEDTKLDAYDQMEEGGLEGAPDGDEGDDDADAGSEGEGKPRLQPTSIGLTVFVPDTISAIAVTARWGRYVRFESETITGKGGEPALTWHREAMGGEPQRLALRATDGIEPLLTPDLRSPKVAVTGRIRKRNGFWAVTLFLKNGQEPLTSNTQTHWLYQVGLELASVEPGRAIFSARAGASARFRDDEERESAMLYRNVHQFAMGHGCAIHAESDPDRADWARSVRTEVVPTFEVPATVTPEPTQNALLKGIVLDMKELAEIPDGGFTEALSPLVRAYRAWIATREQEIPLLDAYAESGTIAMNRARFAADRIERGIALLDRDPIAARAFRFANATMHQQRIRGVMVREGSADPDAFDEPKNRSWRLFQLAFVLVNLPALTDLHDPDRAAGAAADAAADLLWFPTGGGKTEAYLGLTAYTIAIRRLQGVVDGHDGTEGVGVVMRYTLRLLTLQQFQRAAALMCACEVERRKDPQTWGSTPIRIGLWVGGKMTPNRTAGSERAIQNAKLDAYTRTDGDPYQLTACPWCGAKIERGKHLEAAGFDGDTGRTFIYCGDKLGECPFSKRLSPREGLPVLVVDEEIYRHPPALLIATVDKFAQMPWNGAIQNLFGRVTHRCSRHGFLAEGYDDAPSHKKRGTLPAAQTVRVSPLRPPDLIIQDELHLISGPLGTLVGLFETAIDELATWRVDGTSVRPKVIASTATIRRAPDQIQRLFARQVNVFPPNGLTADDNFFAVREPVSDDTPGRLYVGIAGRGTRMKQVMIRLYTAVLAAGQQLADEYGAESVDPWMTLVGYFSSLRELGGMRRLADDDIASRVRRMGNRGLGSRKRLEVEELTSRKKSSDIPAILDALSVHWTPPPGRGAGSHGPRAIDILLATNMISVGVDVSRLGLMVVNGQPKNMAEYIQATSRVGRSADGPGLVFTVYQWTRPRDISHYEHFEDTHAKLYQQVEPLSVTPFASRALERGLSSVFVSMVRLFGSVFSANTAAQLVAPGVAEVQLAKEALVRRASSAGVGSGEQAELAAELEDRITFWENRTKLVGSTLAYQVGLGAKGVTGGETALLTRPDEGPWQMFTALQSMRDVEPGVGLILREYGMDDDRNPTIHLSSATRKAGPDDPSGVITDVAGPTSGVEASEE